MHSREFLCRLRSIVAHRDDFVRRLSVCPCHTFSVVTSGVSIIADVAESIAETEPISINRIEI